MTDVTAVEPLMKNFRFAHLREGLLRDTSIKFYELAETICALLPRSAERTVALRKLLEGKDAAVRCAVDVLEEAGKL